MIFSNEVTGLRWKVLVPLLLLLAAMFALTVEGYLTSSEIYVEGPGDLRLSDFKMLYPMGGGLCSQCHPKPAEVIIVQPFMKPIRVSGIVIRSLKGFAVLLNLDKGIIEVYHLKYPPKCGALNITRRINTTGLALTRAVVSREMVWYMVSLKVCPK